MKFIYFLIALFIFSVSNAQTKKGTLTLNSLFGTSPGGQFQTGSSVSSFSFQASPAIGSFVKDNWEIGGGVGLGWSKFKAKPSFIEEQTSRTYLIKPFVYSKYYFGSSQIRPFAIINTGYSWVSTKSRSSSSSGLSTTRNGDLGAGLGLIWFASSNTGLFSQLTYNRIFNRAGSYGLMNFNFGFQISLNIKK